MPVDFTFDHEHRLVIATAHGRVVLREILDYFDAVTINEAASYAKLFDAREMDAQLSDDDVMVIGARVAPTPPTTRAAPSPSSPRPPRRATQCVAT